MTRRRNASRRAPPRGAAARGPRVDRLGPGQRLRARDARHGRARAPRQVPGRFGQVLWDLDAYAFFDDPDTIEPPSTVNPSLWRQGRLNNIAGLFEVTPSIFQVRGMDISNVTFISGETGWIVIDPLTSEETARAALDAGERAPGRATGARRDLHPQPHRSLRRRPRRPERRRRRERPRAA